MNLKDSGKREKMKTGSQRDSREGKGRYDLSTPRAEMAVAKIMEAGAKKYGERNWEKGQPLSRYLDSTIRHLNYWRQGKKDEPHLWQTLWNLSCLVETNERIKEGLLPKSLNDLPFNK